jgi:hypothetical protein
VVACDRSKLRVVQQACGSGCDGVRLYEPGHVQHVAAQIRYDINQDGETVNIAYSVFAAPRQERR